MRSGEYATNPKHVLGWWESIYGLLSQERRAEFLERPELVQLCTSFTPNIVKPALRRSSLLSEALRWAKEHRADFPSRSSPGTRSSPSRRIREGAGDKATKRATQPSTRRKKNRLGSSSDPPSSPRRPTRRRTGGVTRYGSGTIRSAGNPEDVLPGGGKCPACGMVYRSDGHCRCS